MALILIAAFLRERERTRADIFHFNIQRKHLRDTSNPFDLRNFEFVRLFRVDKTSALFLINRLRNRIQPIRTDGLSVQLKVLLTLRFLGYGSYQRVVGQGFFLAVSQSSVSRAIKQVTRALNEEFLLQVIQFPCTNESRRQTEERFRAVAGFPGILGCIDCTHIAICTPYREEESYKNHHGFYSLNVQMVCDEKLKILNVNANFPGSVHDQFIFNGSRVKTEVQRLNTERIGQFFLLGDSGYALDSFLLTPVINAAAGSADERYTHRHCQVRNRIERLFGVLKARWRCLRNERGLHYQPREAALIVYSCAILHNLLVERVQIPVEEQEVEPVPQILGNVPNAEDRAAGRRLRQNIINNYFNN